MASSTTSTGSTKVDAVVQKAAANAPGQLSGVALYSRFALAGAICCSVTHGALTPVDVYVASSQVKNKTCLLGGVSPTAIFAVATCAPFHETC